jgi:ABC-2 type transport system ATP-binding protein
MGEPAAIAIEGLTKYYGQVVGLEDLTLEVRSGEIFGFLGANGAGKTTTIRLLLDLLRPTRGRAFVMGLDCAASSLEVRRRIGYLPGEMPIYPDLTAAQYLDFLARVGGQPVRAEHRAQLLRRFEVSSVDLGRRLRDHSHGMKRKIGLIQALMTEPPILILDEPTLGLDPLMIEAFRATLAELKRAGRTTVFLSSHILAEVEKICDRIGLIRGGRLAALETMEGLKRASPRRITIELSRPVHDELDPSTRASIVERTPQRLVLRIEGPLGPTLARFASLPIHDVHVEPFRLEDYVLDLYGRD